MFDFSVLIFFFSFLDWNMFVYDIIIFFWIKKACFRGKKCPFLSLAIIASWLVFSWFLDNVFCVLENNFVVDSWLGPMLVHFFAKKKTLFYAWLTNNLVVLYINNMFIMIFTSIRNIGGVNAFYLRNQSSFSNS